MIILSLIIGAGVIALIAGYLGYRIGERVEGHWLEEVAWWQEHAAELKQLYEEQGDRFEEAIRLAEEAHANTVATRKTFTKLLPQEIREQVRQIDERLEAKRKAAEPYEFPSELDYEFPSELDTE
jgi:hypothetical protein